MRETPASSDQRKQCKVMRGSGDLAAGELGCSNKREAQPLSPGGGRLSQVPEESSDPSSLSCSLQMPQPE